MTKAFWNQKSTLLFSLYLFFSLCLLFFSGEEISWGQRLLQFKPPEFILNNSFQYEMNLHNLKVIRDFDYFFAAKISILIGLYGAFSWVVLAFLKAFGLDKPQNFCVPYLAPKWFLSSYFLLVAMYFFYTAYLFPRFALLNIRHREQEPMELILSLGFLLFVISNRIHQIQTNSVK